MLRPLEMTGSGQNVRKSTSLAKIRAVLIIYGEFCAFFGSFLAYFLPSLACILIAHVRTHVPQLGNNTGQEASGRTRWGLFLWGLAPKNGAWRHVFAPLIPCFHAFLFLSF